MSGRLMSLRITKENFYSVCPVFTQTTLSFTHIFWELPLSLLLTQAHTHTKKHTHTQEISYRTVALAARTGCFSRNVLPRDEKCKVTSESLHRHWGVGHIHVQAIQVFCIIAVTSLFHTTLWKNKDIVMPVNKDIKLLRKNMVSVYNYEPGKLSTTKTKRRSVLTERADGGGGEGGGRVLWSSAC